ncbi:MAG: short-chain dehydrogenase/reductase [Alphaproteobacteria bacterium]|nr:short-chain dehydrogenase/reductase [Alphaproteobacteria bacterium]
MTQNNKPFAVVTGASSGIGLELAKQFARHGYNLLIAAEDTGINSVVPEIESLGASVQAVQVDLAKRDGVDQLYREIQAYGQPVDSIAINAGVGVGGAFIETSLDEEINMIDLNVTSSVHLAKHVIKDMVAAGHGRVLFTSSVAATMPGPFEAVYAASKAFLLWFSLALRNELKDKGVTVTALMPGPTETNFFHRADMDDTKAGSKEKYGNQPEDVARQGFEALMNGDDHVLAASFKTKLQGTLAKFLPDTLNAAMHRTMAEPGTAPDSASEKAA